MKKVTTHCNKCDRVLVGNKGITLPTGLLYNADSEVVFMIEKSQTHRSFGKDPLANGSEAHLCIDCLASLLGFKVDHSTFPVDYTR